MTETGTKPSPSPLTRNLVIAITLAYAVGFVIVLVTVGPWEATRRFIAEGVILALWLWIAHKLPPNAPAEDEPIKKPGLELGLGLAAFVVLIGLAAGYYLGARWMRWAVFVVDYGLPLAVLVILGYGGRALGLSLATRRAWLAVFAIVAINFVVGVAGEQLLPPGESPTPPGADLAEELTSPLRVLLEIGQLLAIAAIPEELFFRIYLQPRLARYLPLGWAIVVQALLFSAVHLPQHLIRFEYPWPLALAGVLSINNGLIGGYLWSRTRSLPQLVVLHLLAYIRIGL